MIDESKREKHSEIEILGHDYIGRVNEIRRLLSDGLHVESIEAITILETDMQVVLTVGEIYDLKDRVIN